MILTAITISLLSNNGKFSYSQTGEMFSKVSSYQVKRWLDKKMGRAERKPHYESTNCKRIPGKMED